MEKGRKKFSEKQKNIKKMDKTGENVKEENELESHKEEKI